MGKTALVPPAKAGGPERFATSAAPTALAMPTSGVKTLSATPALSIAGD